MSSSDDMILNLKSLFISVQCYSTTCFDKIALDKRHTNSFLTIPFRLTSASAEEPERKEDDI
jgi:hypothetical protein